MCVLVLKASLFLQLLLHPESDDSAQLSQVIRVTPLVYRYSTILLILSVDLKTKFEHL